MIDDLTGELVEERGVTQTASRVEPKTGPAVSGPSHEDLDCWFSLNLAM